MATPIVVFPDIRTALINRIKEEAAHFGYPALEVQAKIPADRPDMFVTVYRTGGPATQLVIDLAQITIECWAPTDVAAHDLAQVVRGIIHACRNQRFGGVQIYSVDELSGPQDLPDPNAAHQARWTWSMQIGSRGNVAQPT